MTRDISTIELPDDILELLPGGDRTTEKSLLDIGQALAVKRAEAMKLPISPRSFCPNASGHLRSSVSC